jgi:hypothetical protein
MEGDEVQSLGNFFMELAEDRALYNDYLTNPLETMRQRGISEELIGMVLQGDLHGLQRKFAKGDVTVICGTVIVG